MAADMKLPPGFVAHPCPAGLNCDPSRIAIAQAASGADPGGLWHAPLDARCHFAVVLHPEHPVDDARFLRLTASAVHDALASLAPIGIPIAVSGGEIAVNGATVASLSLTRGQNDADHVPEWLVLAVDVAVALDDPEPGLTPGVTCLAEEGFAASAGDVLVAVCRRLLAAFDALAELGPSLAPAEAA